MVRHLNIPFDKAEFEELENAKNKLGKRLGRSLSWSRFILVVAGVEKE